LAQGAFDVLGRQVVHFVASAPGMAAHPIKTIKDTGEAIGILAYNFVVNTENIASGKVNGFQSGKVIGSSVAQAATWYGVGKAGSQALNKFSQTPLVSALAVSAKNTRLAKVPGAVAEGVNNSKLGKAVGRINDDLAKPRLNRQGLFNYYMKKVDVIDVSTPPDKAVFYSGPGNYGKARAFAQQTGKMTIDDTVGGQWLLGQKLYSAKSVLTDSQRNAVWGKISCKYAGMASGKVEVFVKGASVERIFYKVEYPVLKNNAKVTNIIFHEE
jgi:hypothetical protein